MNISNNLKNRVMISIVFTLLFLIPRSLFSQENSVGINLGSIKNYTPSWAFVDRMKFAKEWIPYDHGSYDFSSGEDVPDSFYDDDGYPLVVPFDIDGDGPIEPQAVRTLLFRDFENYPSGEYTLLFDGTGTIELDYDADGVFTDSGVEHTFEISTPSTSGLLLSITESSEDDPITNIRVIMPGYKENYDTQIFHDTFLERLEGFEVIRFMDWGHTNNSEVVSWSEVITPSYYTQDSDSGVAPHYMIELANRLDADPWICIPHKADDTYVQELANLIDTELDSSRKVYIEYSNELWNFGFSQTGDIQQLGIDEGLSSSETYARLYYHAKRSAEIFTIFEDTIGLDRLVRVIAGQAANSWIGSKVLESLYDTYNSEADVYAIAPYFGGGVAGDIIDDGDEDTITIDEIIELVRESIYSNSAVWIEDNKELADLYDIPMVSYEGGQHLVGVGTDVDNTTMNEKLIAANRDSSMKDLYIEMYHIWEQKGGALFTFFNNIEIPTKWGSWGILEYQDQPEDEAPKYSAVREIIDGDYSISYTPNAPFNLKLKTN